MGGSCTTDVDCCSGAGNCRTGLDGGRSCQIIINVKSAEPKSAKSIKSAK
jgi:hypothetical protein